MPTTGSRSVSERTLAAGADSEPRDDLRVEVYAESGCCRHLHVAVLQRIRAFRTMRHKAKSVPPDCGGGRHMTVAAPLTRRQPELSYAIVGDGDAKSSSSRFPRTVSRPNSGQVRQDRRDSSLESPPLARSSRMYVRAPDRSVAARFQPAYPPPGWKHRPPSPTGPQCTTCG